MGASSPRIPTSFTSGIAATHVHWVRRGLLRLYQTLANGKRQIVGFVFPGEFVDLAAEREYTVSAQAVTETELRSMPRAGFRAAAQSDPDFSFQLFVSVSERLARASDLALTVGQRTAEASLAAFLIEMHDRTTAGDPAQRDLFCRCRARTSPTISDSRRRPFLACSHGSRVGS